MLRSRLARLALLPALLVAAAGTSVAAAADFGDPHAIAPVGAYAGVLAAAPLGGGNAMLLIGEQSRLTALRVGADGSATSQPLAGGQAGAATLSFAGSAGGSAAWAGPDGVWVALAGADGKFGAPQQIAGWEAGRAKTVTTTDGTTVVAWTEAVSNNTVGSYAVRRPGGAFAAQDVQPSAIRSEVTLAAGADGTVAATWVDTSRAVKLSLLRPGADAFPPAEAVPGLFGGSTGPAVAVLPDGSVLVSVDGTTVVRRAADGTYAPPETVPGTASGRPSLAVAPDGTVALADDASTVALAVAPPSGPFGPARQVGRDDVMLPLRAFAWSGGAAAAFGTGTCCDSGVAVARFYPGDGSSAAIDVGGTWPSDGVPGEQPGSFTAFVPFRGRLYRTDYPGRADHRRPVVTAQPFDTTDINGTMRTINPATHAMTVEISSDKAVRLAATAKIRRGRRWHALVPGFRLFGAPTSPSTPLLGAFSTVPLHLPIPGVPRGCHTAHRWPVEVHLRATDRAGDTVRKTLRLTARCR